MGEKFSMQNVRHLLCLHRLGEQKQVYLAPTLQGVLYSVSEILPLLSSGFPLWKDDVQILCCDSQATL